MDDADAAFLGQRDASRASVTVSMAADTSGMFRGMLRVRRVARLNVAGQDRRMGGNQEDVVKRQRFLQDSHEHFLGRKANYTRAPHPAQIAAFAPVVWL